MKIARAPLLLLLASSAQASIQGKWIGWGEWKFDGNGMACRTVQLAFNDDAKQLARVIGSLDCDQVFMEISPLTLEKSGGRLLLDQKVVGDFTENHYHWIEPYSPTVNVEVLMDRAANHLDYQERWINVSGQKIYEINARLFLHE
jgi:hypothetical protein